MRSETACFGPGRKPLSLLRPESRCRFALSTRRATRSIDAADITVSQRSSSRVAFQQQLATGNQPAIGTSSQNHHNHQQQLHHHQLQPLQQQQSSNHQQPLNGQQVVQRLMKQHKQSKHTQMQDHRQLLKKPKSPSHQQPLKQQQALHRPVSTHLPSIHTQSRHCDQQPTVDNGRAVSIQNTVTTQEADPRPIPLDPRKLNGFIQKEAKAAVQAVTASSNPTGVLRLFFKRMGEVCSSSVTRLDNVNISSILYGTANVWNSMPEPLRRKHQPSAATQELKVFLAFMLAELRPELEKTEARSASSILWSFAKMHVNPDDISYGVVDDLAEQFLRNISLATSLSYASFFWACAKLKLDPCQGLMLHEVVEHLQQTGIFKFHAQELSNIVYSLAKLPSAKPSTKLLDQLCESFLLQLQSPLTTRRPTAQGVANFAWALPRLRYSPKPALLSAMTSRMIILCREPGQRPISQNISNFLQACAELRADLEPEDATVLVNNLLLHAKPSNKRHFANSVWALAMLGVLSEPTFKQILGVLSQLSGPSATLPAAESDQLYRALHRLRPPADATEQQHQAWRALETDLQQLCGPRPSSLKPPFWSNAWLTEALQELRVDFKAPDQTEAYWVDAVVQPQKVGDRPVIILVEDPDSFDNEPTRRTGRGVFRHQLLAQSGDLLIVPKDKMQGSLQQLINYLEPRLKLGGVASARRPFSSAKSS